MSARGRANARRLRLVKGGTVSYLDSTRNKCERDGCGYVWNHTVYGPDCPNCAANEQDGDVPA